VIDSLTGQDINVRRACRMLGVSESGYYDLEGPARAAADIAPDLGPAGEIADPNKASGGTYGALTVRGAAPDGDLARPGRPLVPA
jgi:hypothetical protein